MQMPESKLIQRKAKAPPQVTEIPSRPVQPLTPTEQQPELLLKTPTVYRQALDVDNLIQVCSKKLEEEPTHSKALFIRSSSLLKKGELKEALQDCESLLRLDQNNAGAYYIRGCAYEKLGAIDQSISDFTKVLELDPDHINAAYARGACENKRGNFAAAIEDYNMALEKDQGATAA